MKLVFSSFNKKRWLIYLLWFLALLTVLSLWAGYYWFLEYKIDLFANVELGILSYDVMLGPLFIGPLTGLKYMVWLGTIFFIINNLILLMIGRFEDFYKDLLVVFSFLVGALLNLAFYLLIMINLN